MMKNGAPDIFQKWMFFLAVVFYIIHVKGMTSSTVFEFIATQQKWGESKAACISRGMTMAMIKDQAKWDEVKTYILGLSTIPTNTWVGLYWNPTDKKFYWIDGTELGAFTDWEINGGEPDCMEPSNCGSDENCVRLYRNGGSVLWKTRFCYQTWPVLCEELPPTTTNNPTTVGLEGTTDLTSTVAIPITFNLEATTDQNSRSTFLLRSTTVEDTTNPTTKYTTAPDGPITTNPTDPTFTAGNPTTFYLETTTDQNSRSTFLLRSTTVQGTTNPTTKYTTESLVTTILESESTFSLATGSTTFVCQNTVTPIPTCSCNRTTNGTLLNGDSFLFKIDKKKTNAYYRSLTSAYDGRISAKVLGASGGFIMAALLLCVIFLDIAHVNPRFYKIRKRKKGRKEKKKENQ